MDFAPTVITLAGAVVPEMMEGKNFLGDAGLINDGLMNEGGSAKCRVYETNRGAVGVTRGL